MKTVPIWEKSNLSIEEAAAYFGIGVRRLRKLAKRDKCHFVLQIGSKRMIKRKLLEEYLANNHKV